MLDLLVVPAECLYFCDSMWSVWLKRVCAGFFYHLFIYVLQLNIQLSSGAGCDLFTRFSRAYFKPGHGFLTSCVVLLLLMLNELRWEIIVRFVDLGGLLIVDLGGLLIIDLGGLLIIDLGELLIITIFNKLPFYNLMQN